MSSGVVEQILSWASFKQSKELKKQDGAKKTRLTGIPKLDDANDAGGRNSEHCTLILTEGDSAKALAISGLSVVGRDRYGVFPLRGKLLNVRDASHDQIMNNAEISYIKQILGLRHGTSYDSAKSLRYGHIMIMTDQDHDGSHIKGLLINFLHAHFPTLLKIPGFLVEFITPIIKATKGKQSQVFYTLPEYDNWKAAMDGARGWHIKYYKGLGTSTAKEAKEYFAELDHHRKTFAWSTDGDGDLIDMAFSKKRVEDRKRWLTAYQPGTFLDMTGDDVKYDEFVNKELILFSRADLMRSIPSVVDGFKPSQRKVLFSCFKRKLRADIKVAQLSGYVSEHSAYHHGEASLASTIVGLAQDFVGSNNVNLLVPSGQFGTRLQGGKDHASPRYIFTRLAPICRAIFPECDDALLDYLDEDGQTIEPEHYLPILPLVLVNGADGIGTGWSTSIPNYNPRDIVANIRATLNGEETTRMHPWYKNFEGEIVEEVVKGEIRYSVAGKYEIKDETTLEISELPLRSWTTDYKDFLENLMAPKEKNAQPFITDYKEHHTDQTVHFVVKMTPEKMEQAKKEGIEKKFKLVSKVSTSNMHCFNEQGVIQKYQNPEAIMEAFVPLRLAAYERRRQMLIRQAESELKRMSNKTRFILAVVDGELTIGRKKKSVLVEELEAMGFDKMPKTQKVAAAAQEAADGDDESEDTAEVAGASYDYLLSMPLWNLTQEKVDELCAERELKTAEVKELHATTDKQLWLRDLDAFDDAYGRLRRRERRRRRRAAPPAERRQAQRHQGWQEGARQEEEEGEEGLEQRRVRVGRGG
jgi:DNA topoisomerase-2